MFPAIINTNREKQIKGALAKSHYGHATEKGNHAMDKTHIRKVWRNCNFCLTFKIIGGYPI